MHYHRCPNLLLTMQALAIPLIGGGLTTRKIKCGSQEVMNRNLKL